MQGFARLRASDPLAKAKCRGAVNRSQAFWAIDRLRRRDALSGDQNSMKALLFPAVLDPPAAPLGAPS